MAAAVGGDLTLSDPRIQELDRAASRACVELCEAIETATRAGVPAETIAKYTNKPLPEVQLIIEEMCDIEEAARLPPPPVALDRSPAQGVRASRRDSREQADPGRSSGHQDGRNSERPSLLEDLSYVVTIAPAGQWWWAHLSHGTELVLPPVRVCTTDQTPAEEVTAAMRMGARGRRLAGGGRVAPVRARQ